MTMSQFKCVDNTENFTRQQACAARRSLSSLKIASLCALTILLSGCTIDILGGHHSSDSASVFSWFKSSPATETPDVLPARSKQQVAQASQAPHYLSPPVINRDRISNRKAIRAKRKIASLKRKLALEKQKFGIAQRKYKTSRQQYNHARQQYTDVSHKVTRQRYDLDVVKTKYLKAEKSVIRTQAELDEASRQYQEALYREERRRQERAARKKQLALARQKRARQEQERRRRIAALHNRQQSRRYQAPQNRPQNTRPNRHYTHPSRRHFPALRQQETYKQPTLVAASPPLKNRMGIIPRTITASPQPSKILTATHRFLPVNQYAEVINRENGQRAVVRITSNKMKSRYRIIDVSPEAGCLLGMNKRSSALVSINQLSVREGRKRLAKDEAAYLIMAQRQRRRCQ